MQMSTVPWSDDRIAQQFRGEIHARLVAHNEAYRAEDEADRLRCQKEKPEQWAALAAREPSFGEPHDSIMWFIYSHTCIEIEHGSVRIILPSFTPRYSYGVDLIAMFEHTSVAWSLIDISAEIIEGEAAVVLNLCLIDYWDDARAAEWVAEHAKPDCPNQPGRVPSVP